MDLIDGVSDAEHVAQLNTDAVDSSSTTATATNMNEQKQPILQWKTKKRSRRQRDEHQSHIKDLFQAESTIHDKNGDGSQNQRDRASIGPLIIPVAPDQNKWKQKQQQTVSRSHEDNSNVEDLAAIQALHDDAVHGRSLKNDDFITNATIPSHANTFVSGGSTNNKTTLDDRDIKQYQKDIDALPSALDETAEEYQRVPITEFGAALLRGMGWTDDAADRSQTRPKDDDVMPRPHRLGLGAIPVMLPEPDRGGVRRPRNVDQYQRDQRAKKQHDMYRVEREKQFADDLQKTLQDGSIVHLMPQVSSDRETLPKQKTRARILKLVGVPGLNMVQVRMEHSGTSAVIKRNEIDGLVKREELEQCPFQEKVTITKNGVQSTTSTHPLRNDQNNYHRDHLHGRSRIKKYEEIAASWVIPNIRVRIVSEKLGRRYYKEKGVVLDVTRSAGVTLNLNGRSSNSNINGSAPVEVLDRVPERYLETALPKIGGNVVIVNPVHEHKYAKGRLIERDGKNKNYGIVQLYDDMDCIRLPLDDIAEWCGTMDDDI